MALGQKEEAINELDKFQFPERAIELRKIITEEGEEAATNWLSNQRTMSFETWLAQMQTKLEEMRTTLPNNEEQSPHREEAQ